MVIFYVGMIRFQFFIKRAEMDPKSRRSPFLFPYPTRSPLILIMLLTRYNVSSTKLFRMVYVPFLFNNKF